MIGKKVARKELEYIPTILKVVEYVSIHYRCPKCNREAEKSNIIHSHVSLLLLGSYASSSTVVWGIYQKYTNGLPLYRQEKDWLQYGFALIRTMENWVTACIGIYLKVLYEYCNRLLVQRNFVMADEMPIRVLKEEGREQVAVIYMAVGTSAIIVYHLEIVFQRFPRVSYGGWITQGITR